MRYLETLLKNRFIRWPDNIEHERAYKRTGSLLFWFPSIQGRQNGRAGGRQKRGGNLKEAPRGAVDDQNLSKIAYSKKHAIFAGDMIPIFPLLQHALTSTNVCVLHDSVPEL